MQQKGALNLALSQAVVGCALADLIPRDARTVLEICRQGESVVERARLWNPSVQFVSLALVQLSRIDLERFLDEQEMAFDAVVFHEVVGARPDLFQLMGQIVPFLKSCAPILAVVQNDSYWRYQASRAGARTVKGIQAGLEAHGFIADRAVPIIPPDDKEPDTHSKIEALARNQKRSPAELSASHVIFRAVSAGHPLRRALFQAVTLKPIGGCNDTRIGLPFAYLATIPGVHVATAVDRLPQPAPVLASSPKVVVLQRRMLLRDEVSRHTQLAKLGYVMVSEFDDLPSRWPMIAEHDSLTFRAVHAVQTSTNPLATYLRTLNPEVMVFPNQVAAVPPRRAAGEAGVTIFFGALNRQEDWQDLMPSLNRVVSRSTVPVSFHVIHDRKFFQSLETEKKTFTPTCDYGRYISVLRQCDIALLPLNDNEFNRAKSDLKFVECAVNEVAVLASPVVYADSVRDGDTGCLFEGAKLFEDRLSVLINDARMRQEIVERAYAHVCSERLMAHDFRHRYQWYMDLLDRKAALDAAMRERVPVMFS